MNEHEHEWYLEEIVEAHYRIEVTDTEVVVHEKIGEVETEDYTVRCSRCLAQFDPWDLDEGIRFA